MIFQLILTSFLLLVATYVFVLIKNRLIRVILTLSYGFVAASIWLQSIPTSIANFFGIGRGLDFIIIISTIFLFNAILLSLLYLANLHKKVTRLARAMAVQTAFNDSANNNLVETPSLKERSSC